ncbi:hypothetical protein [Brevundimonas sp.]|uniref:hypothetical protein n=1 Tax=Brevundimonas sp. TaxID=1871086 RepID=UPI0025B8DAE0|nr:hypothetical protein [Brevundimonas sp.]
MEGTAANAGFAAAAVLSLITFAVHTFVGGRFAARPLLAAHDFDKASCWLNYMTWHMVTVLLLVMALGYGVAAVRPGSADVAILLTLVAVILSPLSIWVAMKGGIAPWRFPSSWLFALIAIAAGWGLFAAH